MMNLLDLPSELLQVIASLLDSPSQLQLGLTCKILNHISLDTFFTQNQINLPEDNSLLLLECRVAHEALWALHAALWRLEPFQHILYNVTDDDDTHLAQILEFYHLIKWVPNVKYLFIGFPLTTKLDVRRWFKAVTMLLQVAVESCEEIQVLCGPYLSSHYSTAETPLQPLVAVSTLG